MSMTKAELVDMATSLGLDVPSGATKQETIDLINDYLGA